LSALRTTLLFLLPAALVATAWGRIENGVDEQVVLALLLLALLPGLAGSRWVRAAAALGASFVAVWLVYGISPVGVLPFEDHRFFGPLASRFREGVLEFYDVKLPFAGGEHPLMHDVSQLATFAFALALALAIAARRPLVATVFLLLGSVWPATLVPGNDLARGALTLAAVLLLLALGGRTPTRALRPAVIAAALLVAAAVGASTSAAVAKPEFVRWQNWDFYDKPAKPVGVGYVWDATYRPLHWPKEKTTVLKVRSKRSLYWRATTLDTFDRDHWVEDLPIVGFSEGSIDLTQIGDQLVPDRAFDRAAWAMADVEVRALRDIHLVGASTPVSYRIDGIGSILLSPGGVAKAGHDLPRGARYTVWSYAPAPRPEELAGVASYPTDPAELTTWEPRRYLEVAPGLPAPPFGSPNRNQTIAAQLRAAHAGRIAPYGKLFARARQVVGEPKNAYAAVVALEAWFRSEGGFTYDESPPRSGRVPPLVAFLDVKRGYCQHFAGAMALMLRYLGIPARVAVGFTSGSLGKDKLTWTVTDHDAHAWVEAWFPGWGWLPFDPTPARGQLSGPYSFSGANLDTAGLQRVLDASSVGGEAARLAAKLTERRAGEQFQPDRAGGRGGYVPAVREHGASLIKLLALVAAAAAAAIMLLKGAVRGRRYLTRDPRKRAAASRQDLADFLLDQGVDLPRSATPRELSAELERALGIDGRGFTRALSQARYAPPRESRAAGRRLRRELRLLRRAVRQRVGVPRRLRGAVSLRSLAA
jgi:transglutaminase-like putative cysteine protease